MTLKSGDKAPAFSLPASLPSGGGGTFSLKDLKGKKVVLYFYPKDMTSGCTVEAEAFRDAKAKFSRAGAVIVGASKDSVKRHDKFKEKHGLNFALVSDAEGSLCEDYGVWKKKSMYGRSYMGIERSTFLIDEKGRIGEIWRKVKVKDHADAVLAAVKAL